MLDNPGTSVTPPYGRSRSRSFPAALKNPTSPETSSAVCRALPEIACSASSENAQTSALGDSAASRFVANTASAVSNARTASPVSVSAVPMPAPMMVNMRCTFSGCKPSKSARNACIST